MRLWLGMGQGEGVTIRLRRLAPGPRGPATSLTTAAATPAPAPLRFAAGSPLAPRQMHARPKALQAANEVTRSCPPCFKCTQFA